MNAHGSFGIDQRAIAYSSPKPNNRAIDYGHLLARRRGDCSSCLAASVNVDFVSTVWTMSFALRSLLIHQRLYHDIYLSRVNP